MTSRRHVLAGAGALWTTPAAAWTDQTIPLLDPRSGGISPEFMSRGSDFVRYKVEGGRRTLLGVLTRSGVDWTDGDLTVTVAWQPNAPEPMPSEREVRGGIPRFRPRGRRVGPLGLPKPPGSIYYEYLDDRVVAVDWEQRADQAWYPVQTPHMALDRPVYDRLMDAEIVTGLPIAEGYAVRVPFCDPEAKIVETVTWRVTGTRNAYWPVIHDDKQVSWVVTETGPRGEASFWIDQRTRRLMGRTWTEGEARFTEFLAPYRSLR